MFTTTCSRVNNSVLTLHRDVNTGVGHIIVYSCSESMIVFNIRSFDSDVKPNTQVVKQ